MFYQNSFAFRVTIVIRSVIHWSNRDTTTLSQNLQVHLALASLMVK